MAGGLLGFLGFGKKEKPNLTQNFRELPQAESSPLYGDLRDLARQRIKGQGVGFGEDFLSRATNPAIANIDANFQNRTLPTLSSEQSKRGIARSSIATDQIGQADLQRNRDVNELMSKFYTLNEVQKKKDISEGIDLGNTLDVQYLNQGNAAAQAYNLAERGNTERTIDQVNINNKNSLARQNNVLGAIQGALGSFGSTTAGTNLLKSLGLQPAVHENTSMVDLGNSPYEDLLKQLTDGV